jgi:two-component system, cell cycle sensor histidine kinase and response regulator CckA
LKSASKLTAQILGYARKGKYDVKTLSLNGVVKETSDIFQSTRQGIVFKRSLDENLWPVEADQVQIEQVLYNLYINAWQAMPGDGEISMSTDNIAAEDLEVGFENEGHSRYVLLTVKDNGIGMDKEILEQIFDPFFTTKPLSLGTGLGLASAYGIIKNHGGHIEVTSKKNKGTTFRVYLPASQKELKAESADSNEVLFGTETVFMVDDDEIILDVGKRMLQILGYEVITASNSIDAVNAGNARKEDIQLIILDGASPVVGGENTYRRIREILPDVNILLSAGFNERLSGDDSVFNDCAGSIQKPFNIIQLSQVIRTILDKKGPGDR